MVYEINKYVFNFQQFKTIRSFEDSIFNGKTKLDEADKKQSNLLKNILEFNHKARLGAKADKKKKKDTYENLYALYEGRELVSNIYKRRYFHWNQYKEKKSEY